MLDHQNFHTEQSSLDGNTNNGHLMGSNSNHIRYIHWLGFQDIHILAYLDLQYHSIRVEQAVYKVLDLLDNKPRHSSSLVRLLEHSLLQYPNCLN